LVGGVGNGSYRADTFLAAYRIKRGSNVEWASWCAKTEELDDDDDDDGGGDNKCNKTTCRPSARHSRHTRPGMGTFLSVLKVNQTICRGVTANSDSDFRDVSAFDLDL